MSNKTGGYQDLAVWRMGMDVTVEVYRLTRDFPSHELYGLTSQMRRCAASVPANIAEGRGRGGDVEFCRFLSIAAGSIAELETFLELSRRLGYGTEEDLDRVGGQTREVGRMLYGLISTVRQSISR